jgi:hypothetical protein
MTAKVVQPMASTASSVRYHIIAHSGNHVWMVQEGSTLVITNGGDKVVLTQTNAADLAPGFTNFGNNGVLS